MKGMGVPGEDVTVVVLTMSPAACDLVATLEDTNVVTATLESRVRGRELIPGIGDLRKRYAQGKTWQQQSQVTTPTRQRDGAACRGSNLMDYHNVVLQA